MRVWHCPFWRWVPVNSNHLDISSACVLSSLPCFCTFLRSAPTVLEMKLTETFPKYTVAAAIRTEFLCSEFLKGEKEQLNHNFATCRFHTLAVSLPHTGSPLSTWKISCYKMQSFTEMQSFTAFFQWGSHFAFVAILLNHTLLAWLIPFNWWHHIHVVLTWCIKQYSSTS